MGYIYIVKNDINDKVYIGLTRRTIEDRWQEHLREINDKTHFHSAIRKYGKEHFHISILEECEDSILEEREKFWILQYDSFYNGYNSTSGGEGAPKYDEDTIINMWNQGFSINEIAQELKADRNSIYNRMKKCSWWKEEAIQRKEKICCEAMKKAKSISIDCYNLQGIFLKSYDSIEEAAKDLDLDSSNITAMLKGRINRVKEYLFVYKDEKAPEPYQLKNAKRVLQLSKNNEQLNIFSSIGEAAKFINPNNPESARVGISRVCAGHRQTAYGYKWEFVEGE